ESAERADLAESQMSKLRTKNRSSISGSRSSEARDTRESTTARGSSNIRAGSVRPR
ncbi:unnamed protein product, partial [Adineta steineri]